MSRANDLIDKLQLSPHPEGGYFKENYRSKGIIELNDVNLQLKGKRNYSTSIYFLLTSSMYSAFHKIHQDEIWHFYEGECITIYDIDPNGSLKIHRVGNKVGLGEEFQVVIPANHWFAANIDKPDSYGLVGCTVAPGFDFSDFELASKKQLLEKFPQHSLIIEQFCRK
ncbi:cupin domain-containing protein [Aegicerativicinus sediminis]|uniref:cupin domain-containing protein n=1 Tax=Aegicerativicinus sediminis TaxID=2893202 RepID=UPI001E28B311|nr:cupin domain-containing protein [Aegicerativicinus sediminis]